MLTLYKASDVRKWILEREPEQIQYLPKTFVYAGEEYYVDAYPLKEVLSTDYHAFKSLNNSIKADEGSQLNS